MTRGMRLAIPMMLCIMTHWMMIIEGSKIPCDSNNKITNLSNQSSKVRKEVKDNHSNNNLIRNVKKNSNCQAIYQTFGGNNKLPNNWISLSSNPHSYSINPNVGGGVNLILNPPAGSVLTSKDGKTNDKLGDGATLNSTFSLLYGKVTMNVAATTVPGSVTAMVLLGTTTLDEIDIEILGGDVNHWQTNVFRPAPGETEPLYGVFGGVENYSNGSNTSNFHSYVIDWSPERIIWSVDGVQVRSLTPKQTLHNGQQHYPSAISRIQLGLWDASSPAGTSDWAKGPIPWTARRSQPVSATIKSIKVECPY